MDSAAEEMLNGGKRGEVIPVWVKSSPIAVMDAQVRYDDPLGESFCDWWVQPAGASGAL